MNCICHDSKFIIKNEKNKFFYGIYYDNKIAKHINIYELKLLNDDVQLDKVENNKSKQNEIEYFDKKRNFNDIYNNLLKIYELIQEIYSIGYPFQIEVEITIHNYLPNYKSFGLETYNSKDIIFKLQKLLNDFLKEQKYAYKNRGIIRLIFGRQINLIYDKIYKNKENDILPILMFISNNSKINTGNIEYNYDESENIFYNIDKYLTKILSKNNLNLPVIYKMNMICKNVGNDEKSGIYLFQSDQHNNRLYIDAFQIYKYLTNSNPKPQYLLFCNNETTNEELTAFLYRSIFCEFQSCFIIR